MLEFSSSIDIQAPPEVVWGLLTDTATYPDWNTTVVSIDGTIALGEKLKVVSTVDPKRAFKLKVSELTAPNTMIWSSGMPMGLFKGVRTFNVAAEGAGSTFSMHEVFSGPMSGLIAKSIPDLTPSFEEWAQALKTAAEAKA